MKSSSNTYLSNLDHLRAFAAFIVFTWHFVHFSFTCPQMRCEGGYHIGIPFLSLLEQGYTGVALFMCISGYIFTYLAYGKKIEIGKFWYNRILRLFPLVIFLGALESFIPISQLAQDLTLPHITEILSHLLNPQGAWTIYIELQYYLALPFILYGIHRFGTKILLGLLLALIANRARIWLQDGTVQEIAYWTLWGHADQFVLGTAAFYIEQWVKRTSARPKRLLVFLGGVGILGVLALYQYIASQGGYSRDGVLVNSVLWVFLPTIEGACYSLMIIAYLQCPTPVWLSRPLSAMGRWSYSIYLDHFQLVPFLYIYAVTRFGMTTDFSVRLAIGTLIIFPMVVFFSACTYGLVEKPFLRLRRNYLVSIAAE